MGAEGGGGGGGGGPRGRKRQVVVLRKDKVVLMLDPGVDAGVAGGCGVGEELGEEGRVGGVVLGHVLVLHVQNESAGRNERKKVTTLDAILLLQSSENHINGPSNRATPSVHPLLT